MTSTIISILDIIKGHPQDIIVTQWSTLNHNLIANAMCWYLPTKVLKYKMRRFSLKIIDLIVSTQNTVDHEKNKYKLQARVNPIRGSGSYITIKMREVNNGKIRKIKGQTTQSPKRERIKGQEMMCKTLYN